MILELDRITPKWLSQKLTESGILEQGEVVSVSIATKTFTEGAVAEIIPLEITYSVNATGVLPAQLVIKRTKPKIHPEMLAAGKREVAFYQTIAKVGQKFPIPECYATYLDAVTGNSAILMRDLSETHYQKPIWIPPAVNHCQPMMASLAQIHAYWWNHPELGVSVGEPFDADIANAVRKRLYASVPALMDFVGDSMVPVQRRNLEHILASGFLERQEQRYAKMDRVTLVHGDTHAANMMFPRDLSQNDVYIIDWQLWGINVAANDLAYAVAHRWSSQRRAALEKPLLQHYHQQLMKHGVKNYSWADCWHDYRQAVILTTLICIGQHRRGSAPSVIWTGFENSMTAFEELNCVELL